MSPEAFEAAALALPATEKVVQWGGADVYKVGGRVFALRTLEGALSIKVSDIAYAVLIETGRARPAPYLARDAGFHQIGFQTVSFNVAGGGSVRSSYGQFSAISDR